MKNYSHTLILPLKIAMKNFMFLFFIFLQSCSVLKFDTARYASVWIFTLVLGLIGLLFMTFKKKN